MDFQHFLRRRTVLAAISAALLWATAAAAAPRVHRVVMKGMAFGAIPSDLRRGDVVEWVNEDLFRHTATAAEAGFDVDLAPGKTGRAELRKAGTFAIRCRFHPGMTARMVVGE